MMKEVFLVLLSKCIFYAILPIIAWKHGLSILRESRELPYIEKMRMLALEEDELDFKIERYTHMSSKSIDFLENSEYSPKRKQ